MVKNAGKTGDSVRNDAESGAFGAEKGPIDPNIQFIIDQWDTLPEPVKAGILAGPDAAVVAACAPHATGGV